MNSSGTPRESLELLEPSIPPVVESVSATENVTSKSLASDKDCCGGVSCMKNENEYEGGLMVVIEH
jgi:hypothetical protein